MGRPDYFCANAIWWAEDGVAHVYVVDSIPDLDSIDYTDPNSPELQCKIPGGVGERDETVEIIARRETKEELGLKIKIRAPLHELTRVARGGHVKVGFMTHRKVCRGELRTKLLRESKSTLFPPYVLTVGEARRRIFATPTNKFYQHFLDDMAEEMIKRGLALDKPVCIA